MSWNPVNDAKKWIKKLKNQGVSAVKKVKNAGTSAVHKVETAGNTAVHDAQEQINNLAIEAETELKHVTEDLKDVLLDGLAQLEHLIESGILRKALHAALDQAKKEKKFFKIDLFLLVLHIIDPKKCATILEPYVDNPPSTKSETREMIVELTPALAHIDARIGIPYVFFVEVPLPLEGLEKTAVNALLKEAGL